MGSCTCVLPALLHIRPDGVHLPDGSAAAVVVVDEAWADRAPHCSVCGSAIEDTFYRCLRCEASLCRPCLGGNTVVIECDCDVEIAVTGVQLAARRAAAARAV